MMQKIIQHKMSYQPCKINLETQKTSEISLASEAIKQWQIQDFREVGVPTPKEDVKNYYLVNLTQG